MNTNISRCSKHLHFLKKLALCLAISLCANSNILHSMDNIKSNNFEENSIIQTIQNINLESDWNKYKALCNNKDYKRWRNLKREVYYILDNKKYSDEDIKLVTKAVQCYNQTEYISNSLYQIWSNCLDNGNKLREIEKQYKDNDNIISLIENKLEENYELQDKASDIWLIERGIFKERLEKLATKINNAETNINPNLIKEMNTAINNMYKNDI